MRASHLVTAGAALGGATLGLLAGAGQVSGPFEPETDLVFTPFEVGVEAEDVRFTSSDGVELAGWWMPAEGATRVAIVSHGHRRSKSDNLGIGPGLHRAGWSVLLYDFRGSGESGPGRQSLGHFEQADLEAAIDFVASRQPGAAIDLVGFSMGAAVSLMVAARDPRVARVVADSPFADMRGVIQHAVRDRHLPPVPLVGLLDQVTGLRYGYRFGEVQPIDLAPRLSDRPVMLVHCTGDEVIPVEHSRRLGGAIGPSARLEIRDGLEHCGAYFADRPGYIAMVADFLRG